VFLNGCGTVLQFAVGWDNEATTRKSETKSVTVTSAPPGATISRRGGDGNEVLLGNSPLTDTHTIEVEETIEEPSTWAIWTGCVVSLVAGTAISVATTDGTSPSSSSSFDEFDSDVSSSSDSDPLVLVGGFLVLGGVVDLIVGIVQEATAPSVKSRAVLAGKQEYQYIGRANGLPEASSKIMFPDANATHLVLDPAYIAQQQSFQQPVTTEKPAEPQTGGVQAGAGWVVAVMNVEDSNAGERERALDPGLVRNLGDQIRVFIAQRGVHTIDRGAQEKALKDQISSAKSESYKSCYDDSCQVELGKALAASHILRTRVTRFGKRCVLNGELIDLKAEVTMAAASSQGDCGEEGFLNMGEEVAKNLVRGR
jgi:hypothetical protein